MSNLSFIDGRGPSCRSDAMHPHDDEGWMTGFGKVNRTPSTSRVERKRARSAPAVGVVKGLARSAVSVKRLNALSYEVRVKGSEAIVGHVRMSQGPKKKSYSYTLVHGEREYGFPSQKAAVARMLERV